MPGRALAAALLVVVPLLSGLAFRTPAFAEVEREGGRTGETERGGWGEARGTGGGTGGSAGGAGGGASAGSGGSGGTSAGSASGGASSGGASSGGASTGGGSQGGTGAGSSGGSEGGWNAGPGLFSSSARAARPTSDQDIARDAVARGLVVPFDRVLPTVGRAAPGDVLDARLRNRPGGGWVYEVRILSVRGELKTVRVDAVRNEVLDVRRP